MKIYVVGSSKNKFLPLDNIREKFLIDQKHEGDNIDFLNPWYCELTGLYYLWKHCDDDIVGLEHYRRYFVNDKNQLLSENEIRNILKDNDVIASYYICAKNLISQFTNEEVCKKDYLFNFAYSLELNGLKDIKDFWITYLCKNIFLQCNMFICKKEIINEYCELFFNIIKNIEINENNKRIVGYIGEYFLGAFLYYKQYKIKYIKRRDLCK